MKNALLIIPALLLSGCGGSQVLANITAVLNGIAALQAALPSAGVSPAIAKEIGEYASAAANGTAKCAADLAAGGDTAVLVAKCGQYLAGAVQPALPPGTPQNVAGLVATVYAEIQVVYAAIEANSKGASTGTGASRASVTLVANKATWTPSKREASQLRSLSVRASKLAKGA